MRVLVTGASGFLGRYALDALERAGAEVVALGRSVPRHRAIADFIALDLLSEEPTAGLLARARASHLLHLAWIADHGAFWSSPLNLRWVGATTRLVEAFCLAGGRHVVVSGSCAEYGGAPGACAEATTALEPATLYGVAKDATRRLCEAVCASFNTRIAWARVFFTYGAGEDARRLIPSLCAALIANEPGFAVNACARRDFLHASDVAAALLTLLQSSVHGACNVSSGIPVLLADLVQEVALLLDADPELVLGASRSAAGESSTIVGDNGRLHAAGWRPRYDLRAGLAETLAGRSCARAPLAARRPFNPELHTGQSAATKESPNL
jgi:nucleoside-diphosphate-sugar epimerase